MKQGFYYNDGFVDVVDVVNNEEVILRRKYCDNMVDIISLENDIELLEGYRSFLLDKLRGYSKVIDDNKRDNLVLFCLNVVSSLLILFVSLFTSYDVLCCVLICLLFGGNGLNLLTMSRDSKRRKRGIIVTNLELVNVNDCIKRYKRCLSDLSKGISVCNDNGLSCGDFVCVNVNGSDELKDYLNKCRDYFVGECDNLNLSCDDRDEAFVGVVKYRARKLRRK